MPRRRARVAPARWASWVASCLHFLALLLCLIPPSRARADELARRLPPVYHPAPPEEVLWAASAPPIDQEPFLQPQPVFTPPSGFSRASGASAWDDGPTIDGSVVPATAWDPLPAVSQLVPPPNEFPGAPSTELLDDCAPMQTAADRWTLQVMPSGLLYRSYLAGAKEPRFAAYWSHGEGLGQIWDTALGGRLGVLRYGTTSADRPEGFQVDIEGGTQTRLDPQSESTMLISADFRVGIPVTYAQGPWQFKTGYYHVSAHLGDEYLLAFPGTRRLDYSRDAVLLGAGYFWTERLRLYAETACAIKPRDGAEPWEFLFGADWAPAHDTGLVGAPFAAFNVHLREEVDFGGNVVLQAGWAWRRRPRGSCYRIGFEYFNGKSDQYEFYDRTEERLGWGMWIDF